MRVLSIKWEVWAPGEERFLLRPFAWEVKKKPTRRFPGIPSSFYDFWIWYNRHRKVKVHMTTESEYLHENLVCITGVSEVVL